MISKKKLLNKIRIYLILDRKIAGRRNMAFLLQEAIRGGIDMVQYRDKSSPHEKMTKEASELLKIARMFSIPFIVNDRCDVAKSIDADGVHVGPCDITPAVARAILGTKKIIGYSCRNLKNLKYSQKRSIDYYGFGPIYATKTKPELRAQGREKLKDFLNKTQKPVFAIGGITETKISELRNINNIRLAICSDICRAKNIQKKVKKIKDGLKPCLRH